MKQATSDYVKQVARELGADLVGIASAQEVDENPPDPAWPQTPSRVWPECRSVIVLGKRMPWGIYHAQNLPSRQYVPHLVMNHIDGVALALSYRLEEVGHYAFPASQQHTDLSLKRGTYGPLSLRHLAAEAGLGTLGLNMMLLTPQHGPRVYLSAVLTSAELKPDSRLQEPLCLGISCGRCLLACPPDAVELWALNKRRCATCAQQYGAQAYLNHMEALLQMKGEEAIRQQVRSLDSVGLWQALRSGAGAYGACLRCVESCPVGQDYAPHLKRQHATIAEATAEKREKLKRLRLAWRRGDTGALEHSRRWTGKIPTPGQGP
ncbi:MAG: hypothetical protein ACE5IA_00530 [Dehalococcoidia bacterium]